MASTTIPDILNPVFDFVQELFGSTAIITPPSTERNSRGGKDVTYDDAQTVTHPCILSEANAATYQIFAEKIVVGTLYRLRFRTDVVIPDRARIVIDGRTYEMVKPKKLPNQATAEPYYVILK